MSKKYELTQTFRVEKSKLLVNYLFCLHALAISATFLSALLLIYKIAITSVILAGLLFYLKRNKRHSACIIRHSHSHGCGWEIAFFDEKFFSITIMPSTVVSTFLVILHFNTEIKQKQTILIYNDAMPSDDYRRLMVELKINGLKRE